MSDRKIRSNKGKKRGSYKSRTIVESATKCVTAFIKKTLSFTKTGTPFIKTKSGNRYSCKAELKRKGLQTNTKPLTPPSKYKKGTVRQGYVVKVIKKPASSGHMKVWRKL